MAIPSGAWVAILDIAIAVVALGVAFFFMRRALAVKVSPPRAPLPSVKALTSWTFDKEAETAAQDRDAILAGRDPNAPAPSAPLADPHDTLIEARRPPATKP